KARAKADESVIHDMAALAQKLGFQTLQIKEILKQSPDRQIARATLLKARKLDRYHYDSETFESLVDQSDYATEKRDGTDSMDVNNVVNNRQCTRHLHPGSLCPEPPPTKDL
ncbi:hypothetical protein KXW63_001486, partial [Aspergillus fumigatus]